MTNGNIWRYREQLIEAEKWMHTYGKRVEHHFTKPVDVAITAYYKVGRNAANTGNTRVADTPNIDDKIFTDCLVRYKQQRSGPKIERSVWFIEDDDPRYLRTVCKRAVASDHFEVVIEIEEV